MDDDISLAAKISKAFFYQPWSTAVTIVYKPCDRQPSNGFQWLAILILAERSAIEL
jgi:hypothetical protein